MRILSWVQNKFNGRPEKKCSASRASAPGNEHSEWPQALLAIGTFGINDMKQDPQIAENLDASEDLLDFTAEEVNTLQKELAKLLSRKPKCSTSGSEIAEEEEEEGRANLPLNRFLNCPSSLEVDRTTSLKLDNNGDLSPYTKIILSKVKDALQGNRNAIKKKSLSFLLKKICVCRSGFESPPSFKDPIPEPRIEKILKAILTKKSSAPTSMRSYLKSKPNEKLQASKVEEDDRRKNQCRWVKTDSECKTINSCITMVIPCFDGH
ncbi:protein DEEPER ROOTING 1-like isoform X1 [Musa acuminata AAA Group]|uniref:protein DEEPER ROOTING 1-like isoform X1 n=1 Tax=Musa acuminata AAA Group TaxID=214697 RepID=UPI0031DBDA13